MKKSRLKIDYDYDFQLIGIATTLKGYRLAWELNNRLQLHLVRQPDLNVHNKGEHPAQYQYYLQETAIGHYRLFRNKPEENDAAKWALVQEHTHFDFILMIEMDAEDVGKQVLEQLKNIPSIELAAFIPLSSLKSKDDFIF
ncbi:MAG: IPExxxVDY family protein [Cyclobacteriaceae bacterium]|nr:IPExxxVDY family protein [Cyclobacteriaceae bacterium]